MVIMERNMTKIVAISDTHSLHHKVKVPDCDILIHAGDITGNGSKGQLMNFLEWFNIQPATHKVFIGGNHDEYLEAIGEFEVNAIVGEFKNIHYLEDNDVTIEGVSIFGSPFSPTFLDWSFMEDRGKPIAKHWAKIPKGIDIVVTHGPAHGILDLCPPNRFNNYIPTSVGCEGLAERLEVVKPLYHIFGHIHDSYGMRKVENTTFINASVCNEAYQPVNKPMVIEI